MFHALKNMLMNEAPVVKRTRWGIKEPGPYIKERVDI